MPEDKSKIEESAANVEITPVTEGNSEKSGDSEEPEDSSAEQLDSNILIAYFTWAENTQVESPDEVDVDVTTSASVLVPCNTAKMAGWIQQKVGGEDYKIDLLFFHRGLQCLVAFELKIGKFKPEYISKMDFYLEALDRQKKKKNENPSVGMILCAS